MQDQNRKLCAEVDTLSEDLILNSNLGEVADSLNAKYQLEPVELHRDRMEIIEHGPLTIELQRPRRCLVIVDQCVPTRSAGTYYKFVVPFGGDGRLLRRMPSEIETQLPWGEVVGNELHILCETTSQNSQTIRANVDDNLNRISRWLHRANNDVQPFNIRVRSIAAERLENRKTMLLQNDNLAKSLGFPVRSRVAGPDTFRVPVQRKKVVLATSGSSAIPEPYIDQAAYEDILGRLGGMTRVLELNPKAFAKMDEEALRFMLLVPLNLHYEGQATGETFNYEGKTDIIIKVNGRNIFIAECLIWNGGEYFKSKIEQLLSYTSWRDTKTAMIIFNRKKNLSSVVSQIPHLVKEHPNCKQQLLEFKHETAFRFVMKHRDDNARELTLTVLVFDVPS